MYQTCPVFINISNHWLADAKVSVQLSTFLHVKDLSSGNIQVNSVHRMKCTCQCACCGLMHVQVCQGLSFYLVNTLAGNDDLVIGDTGLLLGPFPACRAEIYC